jgi:phage terminase small subunit
MQAVPVLDSNGKPVGEWKWEGSVANRGLELVGKHLRMFRDNTDITVRGT